MSGLEGDDAISSGVIESEDSCRCFSLAEIQSMTKNFNDESVIGVGGFGKVYKGFIDNGAKTVAIKRLNVESKQGAKEFWTEVKILSKLRHAHLVALVGQCNEGQEMMLVYEYMARGTLADHLYKISRKESGISTSHLTWEQRLYICIGAARGLDYLHTGTNKSIIHRDVKTTNILLDEKWAAKISDFGLSKSTTSHSTTHVSTEVKGTFGYLDPNYFYTRKLTKKSDVYAFGVVLLEVLCGRPPVDTRLEEEEISLTLWAQQCIKKGKLDRIIDSSLSGHIIPQSLKYFVEVASNCLNNHPKERPTMAEVVGILDRALMSQHKGKSVGIIEKVFQGIASVPKGMNHWWQERNDNGSESEPSKYSFWKPLPNSVTRAHRRFSLAEIRAATNDFNRDRLIVEGGHCKVYEGCMDGEIGIVAVKRFRESPQLHKEGRSDIEVHFLLGSHPNISSLIGFCNEKPELIAVYDHMANGSLAYHLLRTNKDPLPWEERLKICIGAARGLQHLHGNAKHRFIHCNIKPCNILLDENWVAKLDNFGSSKLIPDDSASETILDSTKFGTLGYMAPEYISQRILSKKSDVYSFGMVLLEVLGARESYVFEMDELDEGEKSLKHWLIRNIKKRTIDRVIDRYLIGKIAPKCLKVFVNIALSSILDQDVRRPSMDYVVESLDFALQLQEAWENCIEIGVELSMAYLSCGNIFSTDGDLTIGGLSILLSNIDDALLELRVYNMEVFATACVPLQKISYCRRKRYFLR